MAEPTPVPDGSAPESPAASPEASRPELIFNRIAESADQVVTPEAARDKTKTLLRSAGNATIVLKQGDTDVGMFDIAGSEVQKVERPGRSVEIADWEKVWDSNGLNRSKDYMIYRDDVGSAVNAITSAQLPPELRPAAEALIDAQQAPVDGSDKFIPLPKQAWRLDTSDMSHIAVDVDDASVTFYQPGGNRLIGYQRKDASDRSVDARNWQRVDSLHSETDVVAITERASYLDDPSVKSVHLVGNGNTIVVTESGFTVRETQDSNRPPHWTENLTDIGNNVAVEGSATGVIYYCSEDMQSIYKYTTGSGSTSPEELRMPGGREFHGVRNLSLDPSGNFLTFSSNEGFFVLDKETQEITTQIDKFYQGMMDDQGRVHGFTEEGKVAIYEANFADLNNYIADLKASIAMAEETKSAAEKERDRLAILEQKLQHLKNRRDNAEANLRGALAVITDVGDVAEQGKASIIGLLAAAGVSGNPEEEEYFRVKLDAVIKERQGQIVQPVIDHHLAELRTILGGDMDYDKYRNAEKLRKDARALIGFSPQELRTEFAALEAELAQHEEEFVGQESQRIQESVVQVTLEARQAIEAAENILALNAWIGGTNDDGELDYIIVKQNLDTLEKESDKLPNKDELRARILEAKTELQTFVKERRRQLRKRKKSTAETNKDTERALMVGRILEFVGNFRYEEHDTREQAENYLGSGEYTVLESEIAALADVDPQEARKMRRLLRSFLALVNFEIDRRNTAPEGFVRIGKELFPIREQTEEEQQAEAPRRELSVTMTDTQTAVGPTGVVTFGDLAANITEAGNTKIQRVYQDEADEQAWRLGMLKYGNKSLRSTVVTAEEAGRIQSEYDDWKRGDASKIRAKLEEKRKALQDYLRTTWTPSPYNIDEEPPEEYTRLNNEYTKYAIKHNYLLFTHLDKLRSAPAERESFNGFGYIAEWQPYWTLDQQTLKYLEEVAEFGNLQLTDKEGITVLQGHAGTGKDVLLDMLSALTRRPKFDFNASKWDEEGTLTEEVVLHVENGQTETLTVPSSIVRGVMTPGAIININEINSWPPPARLFLNSLFDAKRSMNLKTSGKRVTAAEGTLFYATENLGYEGTYDINIASISRQTEVHTDYPPLYTSPGRLNPAEAWRTARSVESLEDTTYEMNPARQ